MSDQWYYSSGKDKLGPVTVERLRDLVRGGYITPHTLLQKDGAATWIEAKDVPIFGEAGTQPPVLNTNAAMAPTVAKTQPVPAPTPPTQPTPPSAVTASTQTVPPNPQAQPQAQTRQTHSAPAPAAAHGQHGMLGNIGAKISEIAQVPEIGDVPVGRIFSDGISNASKAPIEDIFAVGTSTTTPPLAAVQTSWPRPRACWVILAGAAITYALMRMGIEKFNNPNFVPGMIAIGAFMVPLTVVTFFFEMNTPRNVSIYQTIKMLFLGGAISLVATMVLSNVITGSGTGRIVPALLTGVIEETAKAIALLLIVRNMRYKWQLNGILLGAAVGAGFAGLESAGYAFGTIFQPNGGFSVYDSIMLRACLAPGGHVIWTAMVGSAIWKVKGDRPFELGMLSHPVVIRRYLVAVVLHGLWDATLIDFNIAGVPVQYYALFVVGWVVIFGILKDALQELAKAKSALPDSPMASFYLGETMVGSAGNRTSQATK